MVAALRFHLQGGAHGYQGGWHVQDVVHELLDREGESFGGEYLELIPAQKICHSDKFDNPNLPGEMQTTVTLTAVSCGTEITLVKEAIPATIPLEMCYLGWQESLAQLANLVEPEIPG